MPFSFDVSPFAPGQPASPLQACQGPAVDEDGVAGDETADVGAEVHQQRGQVPRVTVTPRWKEARKELLPLILEASFFADEPAGADPVYADGRAAQLQTQHPSELSYPRHAGTISRHVLDASLRQRRAHVDDAAGALALHMFRGRLAE